MSFRRFVYYCAVCGGCAAYAGWVLGRVFSFESVLVLSSCLLYTSDAADE